MKYKTLLIPVLLTACESFGNPPVTPRANLKLKPNLTHSSSSPITNIDGVIKRSQSISSFSQQTYEITQVPELQLLTGLNRQHQAQLLERVNQIRLDTREFVKALELDSNSSLKNFARLCAFLTTNECSAEGFSEEEATFNFKPESSYSIQICINKKLKNCINDFLDTEKEETIKAKYK